MTKRLPKSFTVCDVDTKDKYNICKALCLKIKDVIVYHKHRGYNQEVKYYGVDCDGVFLSRVAHCGYTLTLQQLAFDYGLLDKGVDYVGVDSSGNLSRSWSSSLTPKPILSRHGSIIPSQYEAIDTDDEEEYTPTVSEPCEISNCGGDYLKCVPQYLGEQMCVVNHTENWIEQHYSMDSVKFRPIPKTDRELFIEAGWKRLGFCEDKGLVEDALGDMYDELVGTPAGVAE